MMFSYNETGGIQIRFFNFIPKLNPIEEIMIKIRIKIRRGDPQK